MYTYTEKDLERFWAKVDKSGECWEWTSQTRGGYGLFWLNGTTVGTHRFSLFLAIGEFEGNALHRCDNPPCVKPEHLFAGTHQENMDDMYAKGRRQRKKPYQPVETRKVRKLSQADIEEILRELEKPYWGQVDRLAKKYGVHHSLISNLKAGRDSRAISSD